ncbi:MAG: hypothetical protein LBL48_01290 [Azoarcus sp.]|jgi:hypothetical protein|nr:hypothetical protein [Azoarcus sp.]
MSLTAEQKAQYVAAITAIWEGSVSNNQASNITDEVADIMDTVLDAIKECSQAFAVVNITFSLFYGAGSWKDILVNALANGTSVGNWIAALRGNMQYRACVVTAAANWRSAIEMALMGIKK